jgi:hypothetical protein
LIFIVEMLSAKTVLYICIHTFGRRELIICWHGTIILVGTVVAVVEGAVAVEPDRDALEAVPTPELLLGADKVVGGKGGGGCCSGRGLWTDINSIQAQISPNSDPI